MKLKRTTSLAVAVLAVFALLAASCGDDSDDGAGAAATTATTAPVAAGGSDGGRTAPTEALKLGGIFPLTGALAFIVEPIFEAASMAAEEINAIGIQTLDFNILDSGTNPEIANNAADEHIADGVHGIVGAVSSGISLSIIDKITQAGIPMMSPANGSPTFSTYEDNNLYFRTTTPDILKGSVMGQQILELGGQDVAILYRADDYGRAFAEETAKELEEGGANVLINLDYDPQGSTFGAEIQQITNVGADSVLLIAFNEGLEILRQLIQEDHGPDQVDVYIPDTLAIPTLGDSIDSNNPGVVEGMYGIRPGAWSDGADSFNARLQARSPGIDDLFAPYAFDAVVVMALAALAAESNQPEDYASHIIEVTRGGEKCAFYVDCAQLLLDGADIDYDGASGPLDYLDNGEPSIGTFDVVRFNDTGTIDVIGKQSAQVPN